MIGRGDWGLLRRLSYGAIHVCLLKVQDTHGVRLFYVKRTVVYNQLHYNSQVHQ